MDKASPKHLSRSLLAALLAAPFAAIARRFFAGLHESRKRQAIRIIESYRHLTKDTDANRH